MAAEMIDMVEDYDWESDEAEDFESDEAFDESDDAAEDIGERARRRRRQNRYYKPGRGVQGIAVRRPNGTVSRVPFPAPLATAAETNRGLAKQELARRALTERLNRLEARSRRLPKNDSSVSGLVTLAIGGGLTAFGAIKAAGNQGGLSGWAQQNSTKTAAVVSAAQLATSGAKLVVYGQYPSSAINITADIFAAAQLAAFAFGALNVPTEPAPPRRAGDKAKADKDAADTNAGVGTLYVTDNDGFQYRVILDANKRPTLIRVF
jgi:hypothetical protein